MAKATSIKDALDMWQKKTQQDPTKAEEILLQSQFPPIEKMDATLNTLVECRKLSLSTNMIEKIAGITQLKNLRILFLPRNNLKTLVGIEPLAETLEELWVNYNSIEEIKPIESMKALKIFNVANNLISDWVEFDRMAIPPKLQEITFLGNTLQTSLDKKEYRAEAIRRLPNVKKLDGEPVNEDFFSYD